MSQNQRYAAMRQAAIRVAGSLLDKLVAACQANPWLKIGGHDFVPFGACVESDHPWCLIRLDDGDMLQAYFEHGNWGLRSAVQYRDLIFVQQIDGGDEWWTLKIVGDRLVPFESVTFGPSIRRGDFPALVEKLLASPVQ